MPIAKGIVFPPTLLVKCNGKQKESEYVLECYDGSAKQPVFILHLGTH
jgi:hypothetical protein